MLAYIEDIPVAGLPGCVMYHRASIFDLVIPRLLAGETITHLHAIVTYIIRASFSQKRMVYIPAEKSADGIARVVYSSKDGRTQKTFDALDWLASLVVHVPNKYEQLVRF